MPEKTEAVGLVGARETKPSLNENGTDVTPPALMSELSPKRQVLLEGKASSSPRLNTSLRYRRFGWQGLKEQPVT